jgi:hypothetical protein
VPALMIDDRLMVGNLSKPIKHLRFTFINKKADEEVFILISVFHPFKICSDQCFSTGVPSIFISLIFNCTKGSLILKLALLLDFFSKF